MGELSPMFTASAHVQFPVSPASMFKFPVRACAWVAGQVPSRGRTRDNHTLMFLSLSPSLPLSLKINKLKKENAQDQKVKDEWITDLSVKTQNYKIPENNTRENLGDL